MSQSTASDRDGASRSRLAPSLLGQLIRDARNDAKRQRGPTWTLDFVADQVGLKRPALVAIERGDRLPSVAALARLHQLLPRPDGKPRTTGDLALWLARWARAQVERTAGSDGDARLEDEGLRSELRRAASLIDRAMTPPDHHDPAMIRTLADFPTRFPATVALVGDRRERPPRNRGDLFVAAAAITDVSFLPLLAAGVVANVRSDKLVAVDDRVAANDLRGVDLLVIAGPNVNWAARRANEAALFRYHVPRVWEEWEAAYRAEPDLGSPPLLRAFAVIADALDPATGRVDADRVADAASRVEAEKLVERLLRRPDGDGYVTETSVIDAFRDLGHTDPVAGAVHQPEGSHLVDHALVSLAPNPFDRRRVAVLVGGTHGAGTAHAVRFLVESAAEFESRPYGGVLEVRLGEYVDWSSRFQQPAVVRWLTPEYTPESLRARFEEALAPGARAASPVFADRSEAQLRAAILFIDRLRGAEPWPDDPVDTGPVGQVGQVSRSGLVRSAAVGGVEAVEIGPVGDGPQQAESEHGEG